MTALPRFIMFDLDGTLVDTASEIAESVNRTLGEEHLPALPPALVRNWIGKGTAWLFGKALEAATGDTQIRSSALYTRLYPRFLQNYADLTGLLSTPYPGVKNALSKLHQSGCRLGVVTNKERSLTLRLLERHGLTKAFEVLVAGGDTAQGKPSPLPLQLALQQAGVSAGESLFIGDSSNDVQASRNAGVTVWVFNHGYNHGESIDLSAPDAVLDSFAELTERLGVAQAQPATL
ncbi:MAG: phosphoglycolate phosphatase [Betaproteobacteria bacterium]|nr:phosphoglycolate phosphatase [Betaproteobacteria bacterium]